MSIEKFTERFEKSVRNALDALDVNPRRRVDFVDELVRPMFVRATLDALVGGEFLVECADFLTMFSRWQDDYEG